MIVATITNVYIIEPQNINHFQNGKIKFSNEK